MTNAVSQICDRHGHGDAARLGRARPGCGHHCDLHDHGRRAHHQRPGERQPRQHRRRATLQGTIGPVTVTDLRGTLLGSWTAQVSSTDFTTGGGTANETIPKADAAYASGPATSTSGIGTFVPGQLTVLLAQPLTTQITAFTATALVGNNTVTWNPTLRVTIPNSAVAGTYTGTVTHSVA